VTSYLGPRTKGPRRRLLAALVPLVAAPPPPRTIHISAASAARTFTPPPCVPVGAVPVTSMQGVQRSEVGSISVAVLVVIVAMAWTPWRLTLAAILCITSRANRSPRAERRVFKDLG